MATPRKNPLPDSLNKPLHIPFGPGFDVPPPKARVAKRVLEIIKVVERERETGQESELPDIARALGVEDPENYDLDADLFGADLAEAMLDSLSVTEYNAAQQAVIGWLIPGSDRGKAEEFLANPTGAPTPQDHKVPARKTPAKRKTSSSR